MDLQVLLYELYVVKLKSQKLYSIILDYYLSMNESEKDLNSIDLNYSVKFLHSMFCCNPLLDNEEFIEIVKNFTISNMKSFNKLQLLKILDIYKFSETFSTLNPKLKVILENEFEIKVN